MKSNDVNKKHNGSIALWKFIYSIIIVALHVTASLKYREDTLFAGASICVSFFFIVSGYLMGKKALKENSKKVDIAEETKNYMIKRFKSIFPYVLFSYIFGLIVYIFVWEIDTKYKIVNTIWELLMLGCSGVYFVSVNYVTWYLSAMLIVMIGLYPLVLKYKKNFTHIIGPLIVILVGGFVSFKYHDVAKGDVYKMLLIALFQMSIGVILCDVVEKIKEINFTKLSKYLLGIIEFLGFFSILVLSNLESSHFKYDFIMILILTISIAIAFSEKSIYSEILKKDFIFKLESYSLLIYLNQVWIIDSLVNILKWNNIELNYFCILGITIVLDIVVSIVEKRLIEIIKKGLLKTKKYFIEE